MKTKQIQRNQIIVGASDIFLEKGICDMKARDIAKELGCSTQPIYYTFDSLDQLCELAIDNAFRKIEKELVVQKSNNINEMLLDIDVKFLNIFAKYEGLSETLFSKSKYSKLLANFVTNTVYSLLNLRNKKEILKKNMVLLWGMLFLNRDCKKTYSENIQVTLLKDQINETIA